MEQGLFFLNTPLISGISIQSLFEMCFLCGVQILYSNQTSEDNYYVKEMAMMVIQTCATASWVTKKRVVSMLKTIGITESTILTDVSVEEFNAPGVPNVFLALLTLWVLDNPKVVPVFTKQILNKWSILKLIKS